ncbi:MAG: four helix bundle protein [Planctomycetota bacterium]|jgi:four helix bundle protein
MSGEFNHEKLVVYRRSLDAAVEVHRAASGRLRPMRHLRDQMLRSSASVLLNVAEGAGERPGPEKRRFYRMAMRSAMERAATLDLCMRIGSMSPADADRCREALLHCVRILAAVSKDREAPSGE